ncbi:GNAT family N-acetyltransferase [Geosporobacter ferrireducens]|uniref:GNAT family N-acetyltransferase n=1 Tax=Geosporobacter ferrireducens TaxID=1424294 RepID=A0A1D8GHT2_9FIRM|nr:GNAT family N-acetyltransferase [Geosporobacter ferrireducens]AOT70475.1 GNAT family N-acetyltransferase [Geosporobacter ferrireducens]MTI57177.1 GNAT family N-acetyltransferase [Geosporobacter ferrireducens]
MEHLEYIQGSKELLDLVQPLWEKLNKHHKLHSNYFSEKFSQQTFTIRKSKFLGEDISDIKIDLVKDKETSLYVGYCISTVNGKGVGEIDSLYIEREYRKFGLGDQFMVKALEWLDSKQVKTKIIGVAEGNDAALKFYKRYGFYTRRIILEQK